MCNSVANFQVRAHRVFEYSPFISTATSIVTLFQKAMLCLQGTPPTHHYYTYVAEKSIFRCIALLVPFIGNIAVFIYDSSKWSEAQEELPQAKVFHKTGCTINNAQRAKASFLQEFDILKKHLGQMHPRTVLCRYKLLSCDTYQEGYKTLLVEWQSLLPFVQFYFKGSLTMGKTHYGLAKCYLEQERYEEAFDHFTKALTLFEKHKPRSSRIKHTLHGLGKSKLHLNQPQCALPYLETATPLFTQQPPLDFCNTLGRCSAAVGKYTQATEAFKRVETLLDKTNETELACVQQLLGQSLYEEGKTKKALDKLKQALALFQTQSKDHLTALTLHFIGKCLIKQNKHKEALEELQKAEEALKEYPIQLAALLVDMVLCPSETQQSANAQDLLERVIEIYKEHIPNSLKLADAYSQLAEILENSTGQNTCNKAFEFWKRALEIYQTVPNSPNIKFGKALNKVAVHYENAKEYTKAIPLYQTAISLEKQQPNKANNTLYYLYQNLADCLHATGNCQEAISYLEQALPLTKELTCVYTKLGEWNKELKNDTDAIYYFDLALKKRRQALTQTNKRLKWKTTSLKEKIHRLLFNLGECYTRNNQKKLAIKCFKERLPLLNQTSRFVRAYTHDLIGLNYLDLNEYTKARTSFEQAINQLGDYSDLGVQASAEKDLATYHQHMSRACEAFMHFDKALSHLNIALNFCNKHYGKESTLALEINTAIKRCEKQKARSSEHKGK